MPQVGNRPAQEQWGRPRGFIADLVCAIPQDSANLTGGPQRFFFRVPDQEAAVIAHQYRHKSTAETPIPGRFTRYGEVTEWPIVRHWK